jgi:hypothetical protein
MTGEDAAKTGRACWYSGHAQGDLIKAAAGRCRNLSHADLAAPEPMMAGSAAALCSIGTKRAECMAAGSAEPRTIHHIRPEASVIYTCAGDPGACPRRAVEISGSRAYLAPILRICVGWISMEYL